MADTHNTTVAFHTTRRIDRHRHRRAKWHRAMRGRGPPYAHEARGVDPPMLGAPSCLSAEPVLGGRAIVRCYRSEHGAGRQPHTRALG